MDKIKAVNQKPSDNRTPEDEYFLKHFGNLVESPDTALTPAQIQIFYEKSPTFRDAQDRSAFALAMTDPKALEWLERKLAEQKDEIAEQGQKYLKDVMATYKAAGQMAHAALTGKKFAGDDVRPPMTEALERLTDDIKRKSCYREFLLFAKLTGFSKHGALTEHQRGIVHNAGDTVVHGRFLPADDPAYGEHIARERKKNLQLGTAMVK